MNDTMSTKPASLKGWVALGLLLSVSIELALTELYVAQIQFHLFLPLITAVIAHRYGIRVCDFLFVMAVPTILSASSYLTDTMAVAFGVPQWSFLLSVLTAFVFCRPSFDLPIQKLLNQRWYWSRWIMLVAIWLMLHYQAALEFEFGEDTTMRIGAGSILLVVVLLISVQWNEFRLQFEKILSLARSRFGYCVRITITLLVGVAMLVSGDVDFHYIHYVSFGFSEGGSWLLVLVFFVVAFRMVDWRLAIVVTVVSLLLEDNVGRLYEYIETLLVAQQPPAEAMTGSGIDSIVVTGNRISRYSQYWFNVIHAVSFVLMAVALRPCFENRDPEQLHSSRSLAFLALSATLLLVAMPLFLFGLSGPGYFVLATLAFGIGYRWRIRGILLGPVILQLAYLMCAVLLASPIDDPVSALEAIDIGLIGFTAAFFGMLLNRHSPEVPGETFPGVPSA